MADAFLIGFRRVVAVCQVIILILLVTGVVTYPILKEGEARRSTNGRKMEFKLTEKEMNLSHA